MTVASPRSRPARPGRPARQTPTDFTLPVGPADLEQVAALDDEPDWLRRDRRAAFGAFEALPAESNLLYTTYVDFRTAHLADARLVAPRAGQTEPIALPEGTDGLVVIDEGDLVGIALSDDAAQAGVALRSVAEAGRGSPERVRHLVEGASLPGDDRFAQLTRALWAQGVALDIPAGVRLARPIIIRWRVGAADRALLSRTFISLGEGATATVLEELVASDKADGDGGQSFFAGTLEVTLAKDAELAMTSLQELPTSTVAILHRDAVIGEGATLHWALAQLGSQLVRSRVDNRLEGDRGSVEQVEIVFGGSDQVFDLTSYTRHVGRDTTGNLLSKGALLDRARSFMKGMIIIDRSAVGTDSFLGEFGMNLSKSTRSVAIPSLEIDQPDCRRAAHASSVGPIDETQVFYLESRGIPPDEARKFIVLGFLEPVVARVPLADAQDHLRDLLEARWDASAGTTTDPAPDAGSGAAA
jgi:Fe-S cluster assembly scaffold protein SufB